MQHAKRMAGLPKRQTGFGPGYAAERAPVVLVGDLWRVPKEGAAFVLAPLNLLEALDWHQTRHPVGLTVGEGSGGTPR